MFHLLFLSVSHQNTRLHSKHSKHYTQMFHQMSRLLTYHEKIKVN